MDAGKTAAINAYRQQLQMMQQAKDGIPSAEENSGPSFMQMVGNALKDSAETVRSTEALQVQSLTTGKVDLADLVTAVTSAELTLNTVVTVRDKVINAYQDILWMQI